MLVGGPGGKREKDERKNWGIHRDVVPRDPKKDERKRKGSKNKIKRKKAPKMTRAAKRPLISLVDTCRIWGPGQARRSRRRTQGLVVIQCL